MKQNSPQNVYICVVLLCCFFIPNLLNTLNINHHAKLIDEERPEPELILVLVAFVSYNY